MPYYDPFSPADARMALEQGNWLYAALVAAPWVVAAVVIGLALDAYLAKE